MELVLQCCHQCGAVKAEDQYRHACCQCYTLLVKVDESLQWSVSCNGIDVSKCAVVDSIPPHIKDVSDLTRLLTSLEDVMVCHGNPAGDFEALTSQKTEFMDPSGMIRSVSF